MRTKVTSRLSLLFLSFALVLALPAIALADTLTVSNTLVTNTDTTKSPGGTGTANVWLEVTKDVPLNDVGGCNVTSSLPGTVKFSSNNPAVTFPNGDTVQITDCSEINKDGIRTNVKSIAYKVADNAQAGQAVISADISGGKDGSKYLESDTLTVTILAPAKQNTTVSLAPSSGTYGGSADLTATLKTAAGTALSGKSVTFTLNGNAVGSATTGTNGVATKSVSLSGIDAGTYTHYVSANFAGDTGNNGSTASGDLTVDKAAGSVSINNLPSNATFGGSFTPDYTKAGDGTTSTTSNTPGVCSVDAGVVSFDAAGTCKLQASVAAGTNHLGATGAEQTFQIAKATATLSLNGLSGHTYDGTAQGATVTTTPADLSGATITYNGNAQAPTNAGSYNVVASLNNPNYEAQNATGTLVIAKATPQITWSNPASITYGTILGATQLNADADVAGSFSYTPASGTKLDAGANQDLKADFTPTNTGNFTTATKTVQINVNKADQTINFGALAGKTFGDANFNVSATGGNSGNAVTFAADGNCSVSGNIVQITGAGSCTITASQAGNANYNAAPPVERSFAIAKAKASIGLSGLSKTYTGQAQGATVTTTPADLGGVSVTYNGNAQAPTNAGSYNVVASLNNPNYEAQNATGTLVIAKAPAQVSLSGLNHTYDGTVKAASASTTPSGLNVGLAYSQNGSPATPKNAGSYAVEATVNNANYQGSANGTLVIEKAEASIGLSGLSKTYTGQAQGATVTTNPDVPNAQLTVTYDGSETRPTNAGSYAVVASLNDANYKAQDATGTLVIAKAKADVTLGGLSKTYTGQAQGATVTTTPAGLNVGVTYDGNAQVPINAGSYAVVATVNNANYQGSANGTLVIAKANQEITFAPLANKILGAADFNVSATGGDSGNPVTFAATGSCTISDNTVRITGVGKCDITASQAGNGNYEAAPSVTRSFNTLYNWNGYRQPVDNGIFNSAKAGQSIPMKFSLSGNQGLGIIAAGYPKVTPVTCPGAAATVDAIEEYAVTTNNGLTYDASIDQYNYVWKTQSTYAGKCYQFNMVLTDGTSHTALFKFTK